MNRRLSAPELYTSQELCAELGITPQRLAAWIKKGIPHKGKGDRRRFDEFAVAQWLEDQGLAERQEDPTPAASAEFGREIGPVAHTVNEAVEMLAAQGVRIDKRNFQDWIGKPDFPGRPGRPGRRDAYFPIIPILAWRGSLGRGGAAENPEASRRERLLDIQIAAKEIELAKAQGKVIDLDLALNLVNQINTTWLAIVTPLADEIASELPPEHQAEARKRIEQRINKGREAIVDLIQLQRLEIEKTRKANMARKLPV